MRKQMKIVAALSATALLALGASAVAMAAGWSNESGEWQYLDNEGAAVSDVWRKSGDYWFYLGADGNMVKDELISYKNNYYYVNQDGAMVTNQWVAIDTDGYDSNSDDGEAEYRWFYFASDGKAYKNGDSNLTKSDLKTINGKKYAFDQDGAMLYGWVSDGLSIDALDDDAWMNDDFYFGGWNDGAAAQGWVQLSVIDSDGDDQDYWFYFSDGKKETGNDKGKKKTINGATYYFAEDGHMLDDWADALSYNDVESGASASNLVFLNGDGSVRKNQWIYTVPDEELCNTYDFDDYDSDDSRWFFTKADGKIFANDIKTIKGKKYIFDVAGRMRHGLVVSYNHSYALKLGLDDLTGDQYKANYNSGNLKLKIDNKIEYTDEYVTEKKLDNDTGMLGDEVPFNAIAAIDGRVPSMSNLYIEWYSNDERNDGSRKTGYVNIDFSDDTYQMYFDKNGKAVHGYNTTIKKYVYAGMVLKADNDTSNYAGVLTDNESDSASSADTILSSSLLYAEDGRETRDEMVEAGAFLVNNQGTIQKSKTNLKDNNDMYYVTDKLGHIVAISSEKLYTSQGSSSDGRTSAFTYNNRTYWVEGDPMDVVSVDSSLRTKSAK